MVPVQPHGASTSTKVYAWDVAGVIEAEMRADGRIDRMPITTVILGYPLAALTAIAGSCSSRVALTDTTMASITRQWLGIRTISVKTVGFS